MVSFPTHHLRMVHQLDGMWDFVYLGDDADLDDIEVSSLRYPDRMPVPGVFDAVGTYAGKRGTVAYRTVLRTTPQSIGRIHFHGLGMWARVYVDGVPLHECRLPYTGFTVDVAPSDKEERELVVVVDNRFSKQRVPLFEQYYDFYAYGGIFRTVEWHEIPECSIDRVAITTIDPLAGRIRADILLHGSVPATVDLTIAFDTKPAITFASQHVDGGGMVSLDLTVPDPATWTPAKPSLHTIRVKLGSDDIVERFGLRTVTTQGRAILVNGTPVKLLGYCRHEAHPQFGPSLPLGQLIQDLQQLRDLGCNFIRGSHYPQDQRFLDLCDEQGFLVFEESLGWGNKVEHFADTAFCDDQEAQTRSMVRNSYNHPCVIMWGFLNEGASNKPESRELYARLAQAIRSEDQGRLVTYATMHPFDDINLDLVDVVSVNKYPGWYALDREVVRPLDEVVPHIRRIMASVDTTLGKDKPFIISEMGAGAIYGWRDVLRAHWSEEYQSDLLETVCREVVANQRISGISIWQFCDGRTYASAHALGRPRAFNNKGTVDEYRRPKLAYAIVKEIFRGAMKSA